MTANRRLDTGYQLPGTLAPPEPASGHRVISVEKEYPMSDDKKAQEAVESRDETATSRAGRKPAGPHAEEKLTDREKTPGSGSLPDDTGKEADVGPD